MILFIVLITIIFVGFFVLSARIDGTREWIKSIDKLFSKDLAQQADNIRDNFYKIRGLEEKITQGFYKTNQLGINNGVGIREIKGDLKQMEEALESLLEVTGYEVYLTQEPDPGYPPPRPRPKVISVIKVRKIKLSTSERKK